MYYAYILISLKDGKYYYGHTNNLEARFRKHNSGQVKSTKSRAPFKIHYFEKFTSKKEANQRELFFKTINGYDFLKAKKTI